MTDITSIPTADLVETLTGLMMANDTDHAEAQALACLEAATKVLEQRLGADAAVRALGRLAAIAKGHGQVAPMSAQAPAATTAPVPAASTEPPASEVAFAALNMLRAMPRDEAHERARAVVAGSGAYLHETFGQGYASAVLGETLEAAADHGLLMRGGRDSGAVLH